MPQSDWKYFEPADGARGLYRYSPFSRHHLNFRGLGPVDSARSPKQIYEVYDLIYQCPAASKARNLPPDLGCMILTCPEHSWCPVPGSLRTANWRGSQNSPNRLKRWSPQLAERHHTHTAHVQLRQGCYISSSRPDCTVIQLADCVSIAADDVSDTETAVLAARDSTAAAVQPRERPPPVQCLLGICVRPAESAAELESCAILRAEAYYEVTLVAMSCTTKCFNFVTIEWQHRNLLLSW